ncbi:MAG: flagellar hook protein FlgE [Gallionellaceae bacterium]|nr:flagellar hook protein FlgE [Gallionellaceae bacterium]
MGFQQGLSGLNSAAKNLDVIGNNVANANTVGFKLSQAQFSDVYASSVGGSAGTVAGIGTKLATIAQQFSQGNITASNNALDTAISGQGFFQLGTKVSTAPQFYTRNGQFQLDSEGFIVTSEGMRLFGVDHSGVPGPLQIPTTQIPARATGTSDRPNVLVGLNVDARGQVTAEPADTGLTATVPPGPAGSFRFNQSDPSTYNNSTSTTIYDSLGNPHVATLYFQKAEPTVGVNKWNVFLTIDNQLQPAQAAATVPLSAVPIGAGLPFDTTGKLPKGTLLAMSQAFTPPMSTGPGGGIAAAADPMTLTFDFSDSTQYGSAFGVSSMVQDGYTTGMPSGFNISPDGTVLGRYTNGQSAKLGQVTIANFSNPQGLQPLGNNRWAPTSTAGTPLPGTPGTASLGVLQSGAVEDANVDLTGELVNMIVAQRVYQANAQSIKTQDAVLQTITNLR